jgi:hypothetical protein
LSHFAIPAVLFLCTVLNFTALTSFLFSSNSNIKRTVFKEINTEEISGQRGDAKGKILRVDNELLNN